MASLVPAFEIGLWNGWVFMIYLILLAYVPVLTGMISKEVYQKLGDSEASLSPAERRFSAAGNIILLASIVYSVFLPLELGTMWFYAGLAVFLVGIAIGVRAMWDFTRAPVDQPATKGIYRISRNPMYVSMLLVYAATAIACASWVFLALTMANVFLMYKIVVSEERFLASKYGQAYRDYMARTPRWLGLPKKRL